MSDWKRVLAALAVLVLIGGSFGCAGATAPAPRALTLAPLAQMSMAVQQAPAAVQQAYQFAAANPDVLRHIPCYCGCGKLGHKSNYDCYIAGPAASQPNLNTHALGCAICVDITQEVMRLSRAGQSTADIRNAIDLDFAHYGPGNRALVE
jgi:hypothetical protein